MHKDAVGREIIPDALVKILKPDPNWFAYLSKDACRVLQNACHEPLRVEYLDDNGRISLILPPTLESDGEYVGNSITLHSVDVVLIEPIS